jgi:activator of HSP90 ATPase
VKAIPTVALCSSPDYQQWNIMAQSATKYRAKCAPIKNCFKFLAVIAASREKVDAAWLDSKAHGAFTDGKAKFQAKAGGRFATWDGYMSGEMLELRPSRLIAQSWPTIEFPSGAPDSRPQLHFEDADTGTRLTLIHRELPHDRTSSYKTGWREFLLHSDARLVSKNSPRSLSSHRQ